MAANSLTMVGWLMCFVLMVGLCEAVHWDNTANLDVHFRLLWTVQDDEITFEVQVRTHGYIGLGFASRGSTDALAGADMVVGWVDGGQTYFQVCKIIYLQSNEIKENFNIK